MIKNSKYLTLICHQMIMMNRFLLMNMLLSMLQTTNQEETKSLRKEIRKILDKIHITQMLKIEDRRIIECNTRIPKIVSEKEEYNGSIYQYLMDSKNNVFEDMKNCYERLKFEEKKSFNNAAYWARLKDFIDQNKGDIPDWAQALNLDKPYTIEIVEKKIL